MKSQKGITLGTLILYIILVLIILGILVTVTTSFQGGIKKINEEGTKNINIDKFNMYFLKEVKKSGNKISSITTSEILFATGNKYSYNSTEKGIYLNDNIKIAEDIIKCEFSSNTIDGKTVITVTIQAQGAEEKSFEYVLNTGTFDSGYEDESEFTYEGNLNN